MCDHNFEPSESTFIGAQGGTLRLHNCPHCNSTVTERALGRKNMQPDFLGRVIVKNGDSSIVVVESVDHGYYEVFQREKREWTSESEVQIKYSRIGKLNHIKDAMDVFVTAYSHERKKNEN